MTEFKALAAKHKFTKAQWKGFIGDMKEFATVTAQQKEDARIRMGAELKTEWGLAFEDRYAVVEQFVGERPGLGTVENLSPEQMKEYYGIAKSLVGTAQAHSQPINDTSVSPSEAIEQIAEIDRNPVRHSYAPADRPEQQRLMKKRIELMRKAYPEKYGKGA